MPTKILTSPFGRDGLPKLFKFGGGKNTIIAQDHPSGVGYIIDAGGGDDTVIGSSFDDDITGGSGMDEITGGGGDDTLTGGTGSDSIIGGAGDDIIYGGEQDGTDSGSRKDPTPSNYLTGDNETVLFDGGTYTGGNDTIFGGNGVTNNIYGDVRFTVVFSAGDSFFGGDDTLTGGDSTADDMAVNNIFGDARSLFFTKNDPLTPDGDNFTGGDDTLTGGDFAANLLFGDVQSISNNGDFTGGDDTLIGGANGSNTMIGDISSGGAGNTFIGGDDRLVSGTNSNDFMTGDFGSSVTATTLTGGDDTFVFGPNNGLDTITDFELAEFNGDGDLIDAHDLIDLTAFGDTLNFGNLDWSDSNTIKFSAGNTLSFVGLVEANFTADDFIFFT